MNRKFVAAIVLAMAIGPVAKASQCKLSIDRTPCHPSLKDEAHKPYQGQNPTSEGSNATTKDACLKDAEKAAKIVRKGTLAKKTVTATFDGAEIGKKEDTSTKCKTN